jgi:hypothetical protein
MSCEQFLDSEFSECDYRQHVVCKDGGKEYRLENDLGEFVCRVKIDKGFIRHGEKCDWLIIICERKIFIFVELKGSDVEKACSQILSTIHYFEQSIRNLEGVVYARIVAQRVPNIPGTNEKKLSKELKKLNKDKILRSDGIKKKSNKCLIEKISQL